jgi:HPr kinase/phosphorylase
MPSGLTVGGLLGSRSEHMGLPLELMSGGGGLERRITSPHIQKTGLALAGFDEYLQPGRVLVFGESEVRFLDALERDARQQALAAAFARDIPCVFITGGLAPSAELRAAADRDQVPLLRTHVPTPFAIAKLTALLEDALAVRESVHGVLMDILGLGVLIVGESGIGKSECALDLVVRGHRLVADDVVELRRRGEAAIVGTCPELTRHHMEVRGLGVINIRDLFGVASTRASKRIELVVQLERWRDADGGGHDGDRLGLDDRFYDLLGLNVPLVRMPVAPGRSLAILVEVAARNQILRARGRHAARDLAVRLERALEKGEP